MLLIIVGLIGVAVAILAMKQASARSGTEATTWRLIAVAALIIAIALGLFLS